MSEPIRVVTPVQEEEPGPKAHPASALAALRERAKQQKVEKTTVLPVPESQWKVRFTKQIDYDELVVWQRAAKTKNGEVNLGRAAATILANTSRALLFKDEEQVIDGETLTLASEAFIESQDCVDVVEAIRVFYGGDGAVIAASSALLKEAGYGDEMLPDPTPS